MNGPALKPSELPVKSETVMLEVGGAIEMRLASCRTSVLGGTMGPKIQLQCIYVYTYAFLLGFISTAPSIETLGISDPKGLKN